MRTAGVQARRVGWLAFTWEGTEDITMEGDGYGDGDYGGDDNCLLTLLELLYP